MRRETNLAIHVDLRRIKYKLKDGTGMGVKTARHVESVPCPVCAEMGTVVTPTRQKQDNRCSLCGGRTWVSLEVCRGCGLPAYAWEHKVLFCGKKACFERLTESAVRITDSESSGWRGPAQKLLPGMLDSRDDMSEAERWELAFRNL